MKNSQRGRGRVGGEERFAESRDRDDKELNLVPLSGSLLFQLLDGVFQCLPLVAEPHSNHFPIVVQTF